MHWLYIATTSALLYGGYNFFIKLSSSSIHQVAGAVVVQSSALAVGLLVLLLLRLTGHPIGASGRAIGCAMAAGACVGLGEIAVFYVFSRGVPSALAVPVVVGGTIAAATLYSFAFLGEKLTLIQVSGIFLVLLGIICLSSRGA